MADGIYVALSGSIAKGRQIEAVANNLANLESTAYRRQQVVFRDVLGRLSQDDARALASMPVKTGSVPVDMVHVVAAGEKTSSRAGSLQVTGEKLDLALDGAGYFELRTSQGTRYTRDGHFLRTSDGFLVAQDGAQVMGLRGPIRIPEGDLEVSAEGRIGVDGRQLGQLRLVDMQTPSDLEREGLNRYRTNTRPIPARALVVQGSLESSNVNALREMIAMIEAHRSFESLQQAIQSYREMDAKAVEIGRPAS
jgi:flagellar basal-body rod protein FlgG